MIKAKKNGEEVKKKKIPDPKKIKEVIERRKARTDKRNEMK